MPGAVLGAGNARAEMWSLSPNSQHLKSSEKATNSVA